MGNRVFGILFLGFGVLILLRVFNVNPTDVSAYHAPRWVVGTIGLAFLLTGVAILSWHNKRMKAVAGWAVGVCLFVVMIWCSLYSRPEEWQGGSPFLSARANGLVVKIGCGLIASIVGVVLAARALSKFRGFAARSRPGLGPEGRDN
jgi:hypothetical protein